MMKKEFEALTGIFPSDELYKAIEAAYYDFTGDKTAFCKAYKANKNGIAERIQREADMAAFKAADSSRPPAAFFFSGLAHWYIASAAPGRPNIIKGNLPAMKRVALTENTVVDLEASSAKKMFCAPVTVTPSMMAVPPTAVCQNGI